MWRNGNKQIIVYINKKHCFKARIQTAKSLRKMEIFPRVTTKHLIITWRLFNEEALGSLLNILKKDTTCFDVSKFLEMFYWEILVEVKNATQMNITIFFSKKLELLTLQNFK